MFYVYAICKVYYDWFLFACLTVLLLLILHFILFFIFRLSKFNVFDWVLVLIVSPYMFSVCVFACVFVCVFGPSVICYVLSVLWAIGHVAWNKIFIHSFIRSFIQSKHSTSFQYVPKSIRSLAFLWSNLCSRSRNSALVSVGMLAAQQTISITLTSYGAL